MKLSVYLFGFNLISKTSSQKTEKTIIEPQLAIRQSSGLGITASILSS